MADAARFGLSCSVLAIGAAGFAGADESRGMTPGRAKDGPSVAGLRQEPRSVKAVEPRRSESERLGLDRLPAPVVRLAPIDAGFYLAEDELQEQVPGERLPLRVAIAEAVDISLDDGEWIRVDEGWLWRIDFDAEVPMSRLHLSGLELATGERVTLSAPDSPDSAIGPIEGAGPFGNGHAWGIFTPTSRARVEWFVPGERRGDALPFDSIEYHHGYRDLFASTRGGEEGGVAGNCHNAPSCFAGFADASDGTAKLVFSNGLLGSFLCTGQVVNSIAADFTPYLATAVHCIDTEFSANSCQFIFRFRAETCFAGASAGSSIVGSTLVEFHRPSDTTLLQIAPSLPTGTFFYGWTAASIAGGTPSVCIHHPGGAPQAISFGIRETTGFGCGSSLGIPSTPATNWHRINWTQGITEGGSSGSAICRESDGLLFGVLSCGTSACDFLSGDDGYGRWDIAFNAGGLSGPLQGGSDDGFEPNDSCAAAEPIANGFQSGLVVKANDEDHYRFFCPPGQRITISAQFIHANGDLDLQLVSACGGAVVAQSLSTANSELIDFVNNTSSSNLTLRVFLDSGQRNTYAMQVDAPVFDVDFDNNGVVNGQDLAVFLVAWAQGNTAIADLDQNGLINAADLTIFLAAWGA
jgi:hypothetical protein